MPKLFEVLQQAGELVDAKRPLAAIRLMESIARQATDHAAKALVFYDIGCTYRSGVGDGVLARTRLLTSCEHS